MAEYKVVDLEPTDEHCGIYRLVDQTIKNDQNRIQLPEKGTKCIVRTKVKGKKYTSFNGVVEAKYGQDHISVINLENGRRESIFLHDIISRRIIIKETPCEQGAL